MNCHAKRFLPAKVLLAGLCGTGMCVLTASAQTAAAFGGTPLCFEANQGQANSPAQFVARGHDYQFLITPVETQFILRKAAAPAFSLSLDRREVAGPRMFSTRTVRMQFVGADPQAQILGDEELPGKINYLIGNDPAQWHANVATFARVKVEQLHPGISLVYYGNQQQLEYDFTIAPGADPSVITIHFDGVDKVSISAQGELVLTLGDDEIRQPRPEIYQWDGGARKEISGGYRLVDAHTVAFAVGKYNHDLPLVIDPILSYSTYFGGNAGEIAWAVAVDTNGFVYVAGQTFSTRFTTNVPFSTAGAYQTNYHGGAQAGDAFVAKFNQTGSNLALAYLTYLGGSADDAAYGLAVDGAGNAFVAGATDSKDFPVKNAVGSGTNISGIIDKQLGIYPTDAFVAELNPGGSNLVYSTYLGGESSEAAYGVALDPSGNAYVTGFTFSTNFPVKNALQKHLACTNSFDLNANAFVSEITNGGGALVFSTYFGGTNYDEGRGIAVDSSNCVYVTGFTASTNFPNTNSFQKYLNGATNHTIANDAFVAKFDSTGTNLVYSTYLGGTNNDMALGIAVDGSGNAYVTGSTVSTNFPNTATGVPYLSNGLFNNSFYGLIVTTNAFLTQIKWDGTNASIGYSAVFGGNNNDVGWGVAVDPAGDAFVVGTASSTNFPCYPTNNAGYLRTTNSGGNDVFVTAFNPGASALLYSMYLGGSRDDRGYGIAVDPLDSAYIVGQTISTNYPVTNNIPGLVARNGSNDVFLAKILVDPPSLVLSANNGHVRIVWSAGLPFEPEFARVFKLESNTNLHSTNWVLVSQPLIVTNGWCTVTLNPTNKVQFFRLHAF
jgi:hypothetical protein